jgi:hypothetical protein
VNDAERKVALITEIAAESHAYAADLDRLGTTHFSRGQAFIDIGRRLVLLSAGEAERLGATLLGRRPTSSGSWISSTDPVTSALPLRRRRARRGSPGGCGRDRDATPGDYFGYAMEG